MKWRSCSKESEEIWELCRSKCPGVEEGRTDSKNDQEQGRTSQQLVLLAPGGVVWSLIFLVFGVRMVNAEDQGVQVQQRIEKYLGQIPRGVEVRWKRMHSCENCEWKWDERAFCKEQKEKRNSDKQYELSWWRCCALLDVHG